MFDALMHWVPAWWAALPREFAFLLALPVAVVIAAFCADRVRRCRRRGG